MNKLRNLSRLARLCIKTYQANRENGKYHLLVRKKASTLIQQSREYNLTTFGKKLDERKFLKIQWYMVTHLIMGELFADLHRKKLSEEEQMRYICLGPILGLSDILIDDYKYTADKMNNLLKLNDTNEANTSVEKIFLHYYFAFKRYLPQERHDDFNAIFANFNQSQIDSLNQFNKDMSLEALEKVIMDKGGYSVLLCWVALSAMSEAEESAFYQLGGLMQKMNDCVDLHKDGLEGIKTSANVFNSMEEIMQNLELQKSKTFDSIRKLTFGKKEIEDFIFVFHVFVVGVYYKLHDYNIKCGGNFDYKRYLQLSKKMASSQPLTINSLRFSFWKILNFNMIDG